MTNCGPILIIDAHAPFRSFASRIFERAGFVTTEAATGDEGMVAARLERPGLVLLEVRLPDVNGFEVARELRDEFGDSLPIIFVSGDRTDPLDRATGLLVGGDDYVLKPVHPDELLARARRMMSRSRRGPGTLPESARSVALTNREYEVLVLLADGLAPKEIASQLVISPKTVASHVGRVMAKLGVRSRAEAIAVAYRDGLVRPQVLLEADGEVSGHLSNSPSTRRDAIAIPTSPMTAR